MAFKYQVQPGQTPSQIAQQFGLQPQDLLAANPGVSKFSTGMEIRVPNLAIQNEQVRSTGGVGLSTAGGRAGYTSASLGAPFSIGGTPLTELRPPMGRDAVSPFSRGTLTTEQIRQQIEQQRGLYSGGLHDPRVTQSRNFFNRPEVQAYIQQFPGYAPAGYRPPGTTGAFDTPKFTEQMSAMRLGQHIDPNGELPNSFSATTAEKLFPGATPEERRAFMEAQGYAFNTMYGGLWVREGTPGSASAQSGGGQNTTIGIGNQGDYGATGDKWVTSSKAAATVMRRKRRGGGGGPAPVQRDREAGVMLVNFNVGT